MSEVPPHSKAAADLRRFKKILRRVLGNDEAAIKRIYEAGGADALKVLDIACGDCREADALTEVVAEGGLAFVLDRFLADCALGEPRLDRRVSVA